MTAIIAAPNTYDTNLGPHENRLFEPNSFWKNGIEVTEYSGTIETYFFSSRPPLLSGTVNRTVIGSEVLGYQDYQYRGFYMIRGSEVDITWSSTSVVSLWVVRGNSDLKSWEDGNDVGSEIASESSVTDLSVQASNNGDYYFIFYNTGNIVTVDFEFDLRLKAYDISNPDRVESGSFSASGLDQDYVVVHNPSSVLDVTFQLQITPRYSFRMVFFTLVAVVIGVTILIRRWVKSRSKKTPSPYSTPTRYTDTQIYQSSPPSRPVSQQYNQIRPPAIFCSGCGSGVLPKSTFCTECGTKVN